LSARIKSDYALSVIIPNYCGRALLEACLSSIIGDAKAVKYEVILVDCASSDGSPDWVAEHYPSVRLLRLRENFGFGYACNRGASIAVGDYFLFLNNDTIVTAGTLEQLVLTAENLESGFGALGLQLTNPQGERCHSYGRFPSLLSQLLIWLRNTSYVDRNSKMRDRRQDSSYSLHRVDYVTGADLLIPRRVFLDIGGFDTGFFMYFEDAELQYRLMQSGLPRYFLDCEGIIHIGSGGGRRTNAMRIATYESLLWFFKQTKPTFAFPGYRILVLAFSVIQALNLNYSIRDNESFMHSIASSAFSSFRGCSGSFALREDRTDI
jgi:GT2 family glycosyltransferase